MPAVTSETARQSAPEGTAGPVQRMVNAMAAEGLFVSPHQIEMLSGKGHSSEGANVHVVNIAEVAAGTVKVKLRCQDNHECLPFYILVHGVDRVTLASAKVGEMPVIEANPPEKVVRGGDHAILILETSDSRMRFPVICLEGGAPGQKIRVTSPDRKRNFDAEIVAVGLLKGSL